MVIAEQGIYNNFFGRRKKSDIRQIFFFILKCLSVADKALSKISTPSLDSKTILVLET